MAMATNTHNIGFDLVRIKPDLAWVSSSFPIFRISTCSFFSVASAVAAFGAGVGVSEAAAFWSKSLTIMGVSTSASPFASPCPHPTQNAALTLFAAPHFWQATVPSTNGSEERDISLPKLALHEVQNFAPGLLDLPQLGQAIAPDAGATGMTDATGAPQCLQNRAPVEFSPPQTEQFTEISPSKPG